MFLDTVYVVSSIKNLLTCFRQYSSRDIHLITIAHIFIFNIFYGFMLFGFLWATTPYSHILCTLSELRVVGSLNVTERDCLWNMKSGCWPDAVLVFIVADRSSQDHHDATWATSGASRRSKPPMKFIFRHLQPGVKTITSGCLLTQMHIISISIFLVTLHFFLCNSALNDCQDS